MKIGRCRRHHGVIKLLCLLATAVVLTGFLWIPPPANTGCCEKAASGVAEQHATTGLVSEEETDRVIVGFGLNFGFRNGSWQHPLCRCWRRVTRAVDVGSSESSCGPAADVRGPGQKVVSYSFYGDTTSAYFQGLASNIEAIDDLYDGWVVRLYHDIAPEDVRGMTELCRVVCGHPTLDDCYVGHLKIDGVADNLLSKFGMLWRFAVMGDPLVDLFAIRDLDSPVYQREVDAVDDWLAENTTYHIMRDNVFHNAEILGGMWGGDNRRDRIAMRRMGNRLLSEAYFKYKSYDQELLARFVWPEAQNSMTAHDSFLCRIFPGTKPWPTRRVNRTFVGDMFGLSIGQECPHLCRPSDHQDWTFC